MGTRGVAGNITRTHHHWENKFVRTVLVFQGLHIADRDLNPFPRKNVRDRLRENIRSLLIQQARRLAVVFSRFINRLGFFASQNFSAHSAVANQHCHVIDRGILRQGKRVNRFNFFTERIFEFLRDRYARQKSADLGFYVSVFQRADRFGRSVWSNDLKRSLSGPILRGDISARAEAARINEEKGCRDRNSGD